MTWREGGGGMEGEGEMGRDGGWYNNECEGSTSILSCSAAGMVAVLLAVAMNRT